MKKLILFVILGLCCWISQANAQSSMVGDALKEALQQGITKGVEQASAKGGFLNNAFIKIPFPPETKYVADKLIQLGMKSDVDKFVAALNHAAEDAAKDAAPIFIEAIKSLTFADVMAILKGDKNAATVYLQNQTQAKLKEAFLPIVKKSLEKTSATKYYKTLVQKYNKIPLVQKKVNPNLDEYATEKAITGLFVLVEQEEGKIRENAAFRSTDLLKKVFGEN